MTEWGYDERIGRYRDLETGRFMTQAAVVGIRDSVVDAAGDQATFLASQLSAGAISPGEFTDGMREMIQNSYVAQYAFGRGGFDAMGPADFSYLQQQMVGQFGYLDEFTQRVAGGEVSQAQAEAWARMYTDGGVQAYERGRAAAWGVDLPGYPGDGETPCLSNCRCSWDIDQEGDAVVAIWTLGGADPCEGCQARAEMWSPWRSDVGHVEELPAAAVEAPSPGAIEDLDRELARLKEQYLAGKLPLNEFTTRARELEGQRSLLQPRGVLAPTGARPVARQVMTKASETSLERQKALGSSMTWGEQRGVAFQAAGKGEFDAAREYGSRLGVTYDGKAKIEVYNAVNAGLTNVRGGSLDGLTVQFVDNAAFEAQGLFDTVAAYQGRTGTLLINKESPAWLDTAKDATRSRGQGWTSAASPYHTVEHEMAHRFHYESGDWSAGFRGGSWVGLSPGETQIIAKEVSQYGATNGVEVVAEVHSGIQGGKTYSDAVMDIYRKYGGPAL